MLPNHLHLSRHFEPSLVFHWIHLIEIVAFAARCMISLSKVGRICQRSGLRAARNSILDFRPDPAPHEGDSWWSIKGSFLLSINLSSPSTSNNFHLESQQKTYQLQLNFNRNLYHTAIMSGKGSSGNYGSSGNSGNSYTPYEVTGSGTNSQVSNLLSSLKPNSQLYRATTMTLVANPPAPHTITATTVTSTRVLGKISLT